MRADKHESAFKSLDKVYFKMNLVNSLETYSKISITVKLHKRAERSLLYSNYYYYYSFVDGMEMANIKQ